MCDTFKKMSVEDKVDVIYQANGYVMPGLEDTIVILANLQAWVGDPILTVWCKLIGVLVE